MGGWIRLWRQLNGRSEQQSHGTLTGVFRCLKGRRWKVGDVGGCLKWAHETTSRVSEEKGREPVGDECVKLLLLIERQLAVLPWCFS